MTSFHASHVVGFSHAGTSLPSLQAEIMRKEHKPLKRLNHLLSMDVRHLGNPFNAKDTRKTTPAPVAAYMGAKAGGRFSYCFDRKKIWSWSDEERICGADSGKVT